MMHAEGKITAILHLCSIIEMCLKKYITNKSNNYKTDIHTMSSCKGMEKVGAIQIKTSMEIPKSKSNKSLMI